MPRGYETVFYGTCYGADPVKHRPRTLQEAAPRCGSCSRSCSCGAERCPWAEDSSGSLQSPSGSQHSSVPLPYLRGRSRVSGIALSSASLWLLLAPGWRDFPSPRTQRCSLGDEHTEIPTHRVEAAQPARLWTPRSSWQPWRNLEEKKNSTSSSTASATIAPGLGKAVAFLPPWAPVPTDLSCNRSQRSPERRDQAQPGAGRAASQILAPGTPEPCSDKV